MDTYAESGDAGAKERGLSAEERGRNGGRKVDSRKQTFGRMLRVHRLKAGYTQEQLAHLLGFADGQMISLIEKGERAPSFEKLFDIVHFFSTTVDAMMAEPPTGAATPTYVTTNYIDTAVSASDGGVILIGTQDLADLGQIVELFVRVRTKPDTPAMPEEEMPAPMPEEGTIM